MKVAQINIRLSEGGAANVANSLHEYFISNNFDSYFYYGYGKKTLESKYHDDKKNHVKLTSSSKVLMNYFSHKLLGVDYFSGSLNDIDFDSFDIIHLHAVHSHFIGCDELKKFVEKYKSKIIWTLHDYWSLTARCAVPGICTSWKENCVKCTNKKAYPSTLIDSTMAKSVKLDLVEYLQQNVCLISPSRHLYDAVKSKYPNSNISLISNTVSNYIDSNANESLLKLSEQSFKMEGSIDVLVIANNLSDHSKTDWLWVETISRLPNFNINIVGDNLPTLNFDYKYYGVVLEQDKLVEIITGADVMLFTSVIDNNPLSIIECLVLGTPVVAKKSLAADELLDIFSVDTYENIDLLVDDIESFFGWECWSRKSVSQLALKHFSRDVFFNKHMKLYNTIINNRLSDK